MPIAIIIIKLIKTAPYILLTHRRAKTNGRLLTGTRYCFPRRRLSPRQREAGTRAKAPGGLGGPPTRRKAGTGRKGTPHTSCPFPPGDTRRRPRSPAAPAAWQGWEGAGRPAHPRSAPRRALPCRAVPCPAVPCRAMPYLRPPAASCEKGGPGAPAGEDGERGRAGAGLSGGQAVAATCAQPSLRRRLKTDIKAAGGEERGGQRRAGGAAPPDAGRSAHPPACSSVSAGGGRGGGRRDSRRTRRPTRQYPRGHA